MEHVSQVVVDEIFEDRRSRVKTNVHYDDGLTEEQWLAVRSSTYSMIDSIRFDSNLFERALEKFETDERNRHWKKMKIQKK